MMEKRAKMKRVDRKLQAALLGGTAVEESVGETSVQEAVRASWRALCICEEKGRLSGAEFLYLQSRYIRKRWWVLQGAVLLGLWLALLWADTGYTVRRSMGVAAPLFAVLIMPELGQSYRVGTAETEGTAYYSLRQICAARLTLFAMADLILLSVFGAAAVCMAGLSVREFAAQFFLPFNVTCGICFQTLYSRRFASELSAVLLCMFWAGAWLLLVTDERVYGAVSGPMWYLLSALSALYLIWGICRSQRQCGRLWEEEILWNCD